jgi:hypothetical protein
MAHERGYRGSPHHFRHLIACLRPRPKAEAFLRLRTLPGERAQVDWAHFGHLVIGRAPRPLMAFVMVLSYSRQIFLRFFLNADFGVKSLQKPFRTKCVPKRPTTSKLTPFPTTLASSTPLPSQRAVRRANRGSSAWAPIPGTTSTAAPAREWRPTRGDDDRPSADQSPGSCRSPGRTRQARASLRSARPGSSETTACPGWRQGFSFQRSMTAFASVRAAASATCRLAFLAMSRPRVRTPMRQHCPNRAEVPPPLRMSHHRNFPARQGAPSRFAGTDRRKIVRLSARMDYADRVCVPS